jgi:Ca-activated chloride channel family protein
MSFAHPHILWLLVIFPPALITFFWWSWRKRQQLLTQFIQTRLLAGLTVGISPRRQLFRAICLIVALMCLIVALARPQWGFTWEEAKQRGLDIVVAIDTSKSMLAEDIAPNRLARAKLAALDLMQQAKSDRLGLVAFAGSAFLQCPLTIDDGAFRQSVEALDVNIIPQGGTAIAQAIDTALTAFKEGDTFKTMVLFTDGEDQDSGALEAAKRAADAGLKIFTIGIGTPEGELLRVKDAKGRTDYIRDAQDNVVKSHLQEELLQKISGLTDGAYLPLKGAKTIDTLYANCLAPLPKSESKETFVKQYRERFHWPLAFAIILMITEMFFPERKRQPKAGRARASTRNAEAVAAVVLLCLPLRLAASPSSALREYNNGKYQQALEEYNRLIQRKTDDPRLHFNAGAAAYREGQFAEAAKHFDQATAAPDLKLQELAYYNRGNTLFHLGQQAADPAKKTETWEKSLKDYQNSLTLNPQDADAKFNYNFVKQKLEELKQQQQQQQQKQDKQDQQKDQNQQQQDQQQQNQKEEQAKNDQKQNPQANQDQAQNKQDSSNSNQSQDQNQQQKPDQQQAQQQEQNKAQQQPDSPPDQQQQQHANQQKESPSDEEAKENAQAYAAGQMTPEQAQQLLDTQKSQEKMLPAKPVAKPNDRSRPLRDW